MKKLLLSVSLFLILMACSPDASIVEEAPPTVLPLAATDLPAPMVSTAVSPTQIPQIEVVEESVVTEPPAVSTVELTVSPTELPAATAIPEVVAVGLESGRTVEGAYYLGSPDAPLTLIDYSDFLWGSCRAHVLGTEPDIVANQVERGEVQIVFWPVLNHGNPSVYSTLTAECVAQQSTDAFWQIHELLFVNQDDLWSADREYYINLAVSIGVDETVFAACYDGPSGLDAVLALDDVRRQRGIFSQPTFDVNGQIFAGQQSYETFNAIFTQMLPKQ